MYIVPCTPIKSNTALNIEFIKKALSKLESRYFELFDAEMDLATDKIKSYTLDTSQTKQSVTKQDIAVLSAYAQGIFNQIIALQRTIGIAEGSAQCFTVLRGL